jgi:hypothetical protein
VIDWGGAVSPPSAIDGAAAAAAGVRQVPFLWCLVCLTHRNFMEGQARPCYRSKRVTPLSNHSGMTTPLRGDWQMVLHPRRPLSP